jgi:prevent-host-death family protein
MTMTAEVNEVTGRLAELVKQVQAGDEVLLTQSQKPVARIVSVPETEGAAGAPLRIRSLSGHRVLTPVISQAELAAELFGRQRPGWIATFWFNLRWPIIPPMLRP